MTDLYTISIIIPAYNAQSFIEGCLAPVLAQMEARHELIVVDDGSTDGTAAAAQRLFEAHPQCAARLLTQANQGISGARNAGLAQARGAYILFIDSDDALQPDALAQLDRVIAAERPDVIATGFRMWQPDAPGKDRDIALSYPPETLLRERDGLMATFFADRHMYVWCKIFRRDIYAQLPAPVFPSGRLFEDVAVVPRLLLRCASLYYVPAVLLAYRQHPLSITRVISTGWCVDFASALASAKLDFEQAGASAAVRAQFDAAACHFYIGAIKNSYQLPAAQGKLARSGATAAFLGGLFSPLRQVLTSMRDGQLISTSRKADLRTARQVRSAVAGSLAFHLQQTVSRKIKLWQRMARTRALQRETQAS